MFKLIASVVCVVLFIVLAVCMIYVVDADVTYYINSGVHKPSTFPAIVAIAVMLFIDSYFMYKIGM